MRAAPDITVIVNFHDMEREARRTLYTLSGRYQRHLDGTPFEVIAVDNGSARALDPALVESFGGHFRCLRIEPGNPSPCNAINRAVREARGTYVMVCIDGARMLSPGVISLVRQALSRHASPFVYTLGMHIGHKPQNELLEEGYCQDVEDRLLETVDWKQDGYSLFSISSVAYSSRNGFFSQLSESNCFAMRKDDYLGVGGLDERFASAGGGLVNLDFFNVVHQREGMQPVMLLGEATFHQFHGGVATNVPRSEHPWDRMAREYEGIRGVPFASAWRPPEYLGWLSPVVHGRLIAA